MDGLKEFIQSDGAKEFETVNNLIQNKLLKGLEPETSGGLLLALPEDRAESFVAKLREQGHKCYIIADIEECEEKAVEINECNIV